MISAIGWLRRTTWPCLVPAFVLLAALVALDCSFHTERRKSVRFRTLEEFRQFARSNDLLVVVDALGQHDNFYVVERPAPISRLRNLRKNRCGKSPEWKGVVWVLCLLNHNDKSCVFLPNSVTGHSRVWRAVFAAGDGELLDRIERLYRSR